MHVRTRTKRGTPLGRELGPWRGTPFELAGDAHACSAIMLIDRRRLLTCASSAGALRMSLGVNAVVQIERQVGRSVKGQNRQPDAIIGKVSSAAGRLGWAKR
eukprot:scaffold375224_cov42-Prasinocladus_malaysianus.AAC.1